MSVERNKYTIKLASDFKRNISLYVWTQCNLHYVHILSDEMQSSEPKAMSVKTLKYTGSTSSQNGAHYSCFWGIRKRLSLEFSHIIHYLSHPSQLSSGVTLSTTHY